MEEGETDNTVHSLQCLCTQQVECTMYKYMHIGTMPLLHIYVYMIVFMYMYIHACTCTYFLYNVIHVHVHAHVHVAHCSLNM